MCPTAPPPCGRMGRCHENSVPLRPGFLFGCCRWPVISVTGTMALHISSVTPRRLASAAAKIARIDIDADEIATAPRRIDIGIVGDRND